MKGRLQGGGSQCLIQTNKVQVENGESIVVTVRALDEKYAPLYAPQLEMTVTPLSAAGQPISAEPAKSVVLLPMAGRDGYYQGRFIAERVGMARLTLKMACGEPGAQKDIAIVAPDI